jgi:microsomal dipeptidase-like Zn-dependent dipeptidase
MILPLVVLPILSGCAGIIDAHLNRVDSTTPPAVPPAHGRLHRSLFVADLHADTLMWQRDLLRRATIGHVDLPRLWEGGIDLQVFTVVTKTPREDLIDGLPDHHCVPRDGINTAALLAIAQGQPPGRWVDPLARALHQAERLRDAARRSQLAAAAGHPGGEVPILVMVETAEDLHRLRQGQARGERLVGAVLGLEGAPWVELPPEIDQLHHKHPRRMAAIEATAEAAAATLFAAGFRMVAPTHRFDNALAGASEGCRARGLTDLGRAFLHAVERRGMVVDLAHASPRTLRDALTPESDPPLRQPVVISHVGVAGHCATPCYPYRTLSDDEIALVARQGGVIGIGFWPEAVGRGGVTAVRGAMLHLYQVLQSAAVAGPRQVRQPGWMPAQHIAFGSDFDGAVSVPFDVRGMPAMTASLLEAADGEPEARFTEAELRWIAGLSVCRLFALRLPGGSSASADDVCGTSTAGRRDAALPPKRSSESRGMQP